MRVGHIVTRPVETCAATENAYTVAARMRRSHVGDLPVVEYRDGEAVPVGLITDRDLVVTVLAGRADPANTTAGELMSDVIAVREDDDVGVALEQMRRLGVRRLPVVDDTGALTGIVSLDDVIEHLAAMLADVSRVSTVQRIVETRLRT